MKANIERTDKKRVVIVGGGLGGLELAEADGCRLSGSISG